jgi:hypothetical protein
MSLVYKQKLFCCGDVINFRKVQKKNIGRLSEGRGAWDVIGVSISGRKCAMKRIAKMCNVNS